MHIQEQYRAIVNSRTPKEFFQNIPWGLIEILSAIMAMTIQKYSKILMVIY